MINTALIILGIGNLLVSFLIICAVTELTAAIDKMSRSIDLNIRIFNANQKLLIDAINNNFINKEEETQC